MHLRACSIVHVQGQHDQKRQQLAVTVSTAILHGCPSITYTAAGHSVTHASVARETIVHVSFVRPSAVLCNKAWYASLKYLSDHAGVV
jgi:hypothetical protein